MYCKIGVSINEVVYFSETANKALCAQKSRVPFYCIGMFKATLSVGALVHIKKFILT